MYNGFEFLDILTIMSFLIGLENLELNKKQVNSLMSEMQDHQNMMLSESIEQNKIIIQQNEEIIKLLKEKQDA